MNSPKIFVAWFSRKTNNFLNRNFNFIHLPLLASHLAPLGYAKINPMAINMALTNMPIKSQNMPENKKVKLKVLIVLW